TATPINNDLFDLFNQIKLFTQNDPAYFRAAGIGDLNRYFKAARRMARQEGSAPGDVLFNLLEEFVVRNTRPYIRAVFPNATINGEPVKFPERRLRTVEYDMASTIGGGRSLYREIASKIESLSLAPYALETYRKPEYQVDELERGREKGLVGIFKTRFLKRLESSIEAFRLSLKRAVVFEQAYLDFLLSGKIVPSKAFWKSLRLAGLEAEDEIGADDLADRLDQKEKVTEFLSTLETVDLNQYDLRHLKQDIERDITALVSLLDASEPLRASDSKIDRLRNLLSKELAGQKVIIFSSFKDTVRYLHRELTGDDSRAWRQAAGNPEIRRVDSGNHPEERSVILGAFAPVASGLDPGRVEPIDILITTDVLSEGQNLQDCGMLINYDLTWNPVRLVQRNGRIDRLKSPHDVVTIHNMFPERELEDLLGLVERLSNRIAQIDEMGFLDASVLGEVVHPRTFNTLRRIRDEDGTVIDDEEARAELAGPEMLIKELREMLSREGAEEVVDLPDGIHSGKRTDGFDGIFFHFRVRRQLAKGGSAHVRHLWRFIDAHSGAITDNRFRVAQIIACNRDESRHIGDQDVFLLQEKVIEQIIGEDMSTADRASAGGEPDRVQRALDETIKDMMRRGTVDRQIAKAVRPFLEQPVGRGVLNSLKELQKQHTNDKEDEVLLEGLQHLAEEFGKDDDREGAGPTLSRDDIELVCFEYVTG
ncbi:MAG: C-terminal helicase domain-containing protein, partial [Planctomycetota bacterium]|nr:C-terminal helicase domain-containing protein [Planctomycetota bacterium]